MVEKIKLTAEDMRLYLKRRLSLNLLDDKDIDTLMDAVIGHNKKLSKKITKYEKALEDIANTNLWSKKKISKEREIAIDILGK